MMLRVIIFIMIGRYNADILCNLCIVANRYLPNTLYVASWRIAWACVGANENILIPIDPTGRVYRPIDAMISSYDKMLPP